MTKLTGMSRAIYIDYVFDCPTIIWMNRLPQAVVMSYHKQRWSYKAKPDDFAGKSTHDLIQEYADLYSSIQEDRDALRRFEFVELKYEDLIANPEGMMEHLCEECGLQFSSTFMKQVVRDWHIETGTNKAYKKGLTAEEEGFLNQLMEPHCLELGYPVET